MQAPPPLRQRIARAVYRAARGAIHAGLGSRPAMSIARLCGVRRASVFMFHRFSDGHVPGGTDPAMLRRMLASLRRQGVSFLRLNELLCYVAERKQLAGPTAVITVDDGYADFEQLAAPIFDGYDVRPTVFLVTEFVSGRQWCWWDRITETFNRTRRRDVTLLCGGKFIRYVTSTPEERRASAESFIEVLKTVPDCERLRVLASIGGCLDVELEPTPPPRYEAMSWDAVRRLERAGVDFAPHTMTHPMLSRLPESHVRKEIVGSWCALRRELSDPTPIFCYPNGTPDSYGQREIDAVRASGMLGAVAFRRRYVDPCACNETDRYSLARFSAPSDPLAASYLASGLALEDR